MTSVDTLNTVDLKHEFRLISKILLFAVVGVNIFIFPDKSIDPINSPKLFMLGTFGVLSFVALCQVLFKNFVYLREPQFLIAFLFLSQMSITLIVSGRVSDQFFGTFGRNTGYLTFASLVSLFLCASVIRKVDFIENLSKTLILCGVFALGYGLLQALNLDPVNWAKSGYTPIFGFLGNPNFESAFLGMTASAYLSFVLSNKRTKLERTVYLSLIFLNVYVILESHSEQGLLVLLSGALVVVILFLFSVKIWSLFTLSTLFGFFIGVLSILGLTNRGPLAGILYKDSITYRGDYWRAAWKMGWENPVTGVGIDRFGENYRAYRDLVATIRRGPDVTSNSAHNVFLDIFSNIGLLGAILYLLLHILTIFSIIRFLRKSTDFNVSFIALVGAWVAYVSQSIISVNQIGLAVWGWILMGAIIGVSHISKTEPSFSDALKHKKTKKIAEKFPPAKIISVYLGIAAGILISIWPLAKDISYVNALKSGDAIKIQASAYKLPLDSQKIFDISNLLLENKLDKQSLQVAREGVKVFPNTFEIWKILSVQPLATNREIVEAKNQMRRLDPLNPNLK